MNIVSIKNEALTDKVVFENDGEIDIRSIKTFGISSKENSKAIGYFGTGLKYAIAVLLREGLDITIYSGLNKYTFDVNSSKVRVTNFDFVRINKRPIGFTTELGKDWDLWEAYRELYCNCTDESGRIYNTINDVVPQKGKTIIVVEGESFSKQHQNAGEVVVTGTPIYKTASLEIYPGESKYIFYRGIRVSDDKPTMYTYNILNKVQLTENRTIQYNFQIRDLLRDELIRCQNPDIIRNVLMSNQFKFAGLNLGYFESSIEFEHGESVPSSQFLNQVSELSKNPSIKFNRSSISFAAKFDSGLKSSFKVSLDTLNAQRLARAIEFSKKLGFEVDEYPIEVHDNFNHDVLGEAKDGKILLSPRCFSLGTKVLAQTLIEEFLHLKHGLWDCTREMQNFLFETITNQGEKLLGETI